MRKVLTIACLVAGLLAARAMAGTGAEDDWLIRLVPEAQDDPPKTIDAAESMTGNAAPVVPQRQSERKQPPEPDYLVGKVIWGESAVLTDPAGGTMAVDDWNLAPGDVSRLMERGRALGQHYHWSNVHLDAFSYDPRRMPVLFFSGVRRLRLHRAHQDALRQYVLRGGMVILDSVYGSPHFTVSAKETFAALFPDNPFRVVPDDHPILHTFHAIDALRYPGQPDTRDPHLMAIYIGARIGVLLLPYGMGTGLTGEQDVFGVLRERGLEPRYMCPESAARLGVNIAGYAVGYADVGDIQGRPEVLTAADTRPPSDQFVFAQIRHAGAWNTHPGAAASLLQMVRQRSAIRVHLKRQAVDLGSDDLSAYPFLYLTGLDTFAFTDRERQTLRDYLARGGFLLVNNGLGLSRFHQSALDELERLLPGESLEPLPPDHTLFRLPAAVDAVAYTPALRRQQPELGRQPLLLGMHHRGELAIVYSPYDLEAGWLNTHFPLMRGYENASAQQLGLNLVAYSMLR